MGGDLRRPLSIGRLLALNSLWFGLNFQTAALLPVVVPAQVLLLVAPRGGAASAGQAAYLGWLGAGAAVVALVVQPLAGRLSDSFGFGWGRRKPVVLAGMVLIVASVAWLSGARGAALYAGGFLLLQAGNNAATAAYQALLPDVVPPSQRGSASGVLGVMQILGNAASLGLALALLSQVTAANQEAAGTGTVRFLVFTTAGLLACCAVTVLGVREGEAGGPRPASTGMGAWLGLGKSNRRNGRFALLRQLAIFCSIFLGLASWVEPWRHASYRWVFGARGLVMMGVTLFMTFIEFYFVRVVHIADFVTATATVALVALGVAVVGAAALGAVSDRTRRVPLACGATVLMALAAALFLVPGAVALLWPLGAVFGLGYGAYMSVDWALAVDSLPSAQAAGRDLGVFSLAGTLPALVGPAVGGGLVSVLGALGRTDQGYEAVFVLAVVCFLAGAVAVLGVRERGGQAGQTLRM